MIQTTINSRLNRDPNLCESNFGNYDNYDENIEIPKCYREINLENFWYSNNTWENFNKQNRLQVLELRRAEKEVFEDLKNFKNEVKPVFGKYTEWNSAHGDFYVTEELPDKSQKLKNRLNKLSKIKYQLSTFLFGTLLIIALVSSLVARF